MDFLLAVAFGFAKALSRQKDQFVAPITPDAGGGGDPSLDFQEADNSQYIGQVV